MGWYYPISVCIFFSYSVSVFCFILLVFVSPFLHPHQPHYANIFWQTVFDVNRRRLLKSFGVWILVMLMASHSQSARRKLKRQQWHIFVWAACCLRGTPRAHKTVTRYVHCAMKVDTHIRRTDYVHIQCQPLAYFASANADVLRNDFQCNILLKFSVITLEMTH